MINVFQPRCNQLELIAMAKVLESGWLGKGQKVAEFEAAWAGHIGASPEQVVSTNSCTEALFTAIRLLDIKAGDEVIIPTIHFIGAAQAVLDAGAVPVFCDVDSRTLNTTADFILSKITKKTKAIILNHYGGVPCRMDEIMLLLEQWPGIYLIEDAANAPVSTYQGKAVGTFGDIGVWSFDAMKIITTGDGGMMHIKDKEAAVRVRRLLYLGTDTQSGLSSNTERWWEFGVEIEGARRSVMNDIAAAMGLEQLKKLEGFIEKRQRLYLRYDIGLSGLPITTPLPNYGEPCSYYFYWIQTPRRDELASFLKEAGVYTTFRYYPLHWAYNIPDYLPNAEKAARETLLLPLHQSLTDGEVEYICGKIRKFYRA